MEHDQEPAESAEDQNEYEPDGCGTIILKVIAGIIVLFFVAVALVFGVCLMA